MIDPRVSLWEKVSNNSKACWSNLIWTVSISPTLSPVECSSDIKLSWEQILNIKDGAWPWGAMRVANPFKEGTSAKQRRSGLEGRRLKSLGLHGLFTAKSLIKSTLPRVIWIENIHSCVRCIDGLSICFTCERCNMSSVNKWFNLEVASLKK